MNTPTVENYLKAIYRHSQQREQNPLVSLGDLAQDLEVTPGTVTQMMKNLHQQGLVLYQSRQGVKLTDKGTRVALNILRRHRLIELFLVKIMGLDWAEVHREAEELEHVVSEVLVNRMDEMLGFPTQDPHGAPIPTATGMPLDHHVIPLIDCSPGMYKLSQVEDSSSDFLNWLREKELVPGATLQLIRHDPLAETTMVYNCKECPLAISFAVASRLMVVKLA